MGSSISVNPNFLAATSSLIISFKTQSKYRSGFSITVALNSNFVLPAGILPCTCSIIAAPSCTVSSNVVTISGGSATIAPNTQVDITLQNVRTPRCPAVENLMVSVMSSTFMIEQGNLAFNTALLPLASLIVDSISASSFKGQEANTLAISLSHLITLSQNSLVIATLPPESSYVSPLCEIVSGLDVGATCTHKGSGVFWVENGLSTADRSPSSGSIVLRFSSFLNPRGLGIYPLKFEVSTSSSSGCIYSRASSTLSVESIPSMLKVTMAVSKTYRNSFESYQFDISPRSNAISSGDKLEIVLPSSMSTASGFVCQGLSANLISLTCASSKPGVITLTPQVDVAAYSSNHSIAVSLKYLRNPDVSGLVSGFNFNLVGSSGKPYENYSSLSYTYENFVTPEKGSLAFSSDLVGEPNSLTLTIKVPIRIPAQSTLVLNFSSKFKVNSQSSILSASSLPISMKAVNTAENTISLQVNSDISENNLISIILNASNPQTMQILPDDAKITLLTPDNMQLFSIKAIPSSLTFKCIDNCQNCFGHYSNCSACNYGYYLSQPSGCQVQTKHDQLLPYFLFISCGGFIFFFMIIYGKIFSQVNYSSNRAFSLFKVVNFLFLVYFGYTFGSNPIEMYLKYICFGILAFHLLINFSGFYFVRSPTLKPFYSSRNIEENGHMISLPAEEDRGSHDDQLERRNTFSLNLLGTLSVIISLSLSRWFYGGYRKNFGIYWYLNANHFRKLRIAYEIYEFLYNLLVLLPLTGLCVFHLQATDFKEIHKYMIECGALTVLNILLHIVSFCELLPVKKTAEEVYLERNLNDTSNRVNESKIKDGKSLLLDSTLKQGSFSEDFHQGLEPPLKEKSTQRLFQNKKSTTSLHDKKFASNSVHDEEVPSSNRMLNESTSKNTTRMDYSKIGSLMIVPSKPGVRSRNGDSPRFGKEFEYNEEEQEGSYPAYPTPANIRQQKTMPDIKLIKLPEGTIRPKLDAPSPVRKEIKLNPEEKAKDEASLPHEQSKPILLDHSKPEADFKYTSQKTNLKDLETHSKVKSPEKSRFKDNQLFSKWWFNNDAKKYLEIVYEEEDDATKLQENIDYENKPSPTLPSKFNKNFLSDSKGNISISDASIRSEKWPERFINGQLEQNLNKGILKDRNGIILDLKQHKKTCFSEGVFSVPHLEDKIILNAQNPGLFIKGLIRDVEGRLFRMIDQDFEMLKDGIFLKRDGSIDNINGQLPEKIDIGIFVDRTSKLIDLKDQDPLCFDKNKFLISTGITLSFDSLQDHNRFSLGLIRLPDGQELRIKDQDLEEIYNHGVYRDRDLNPIIFHRRNKGFSDQELETIPENQESSTKITEKFNPTLHHKLYGKFEKSRESIASNSRHEDSKKSLSNINELPDQEIVDTELDTLHHYPMVPHQSNSKLEHGKDKNRSNRQSFESFGPIFPLKHNPLKNKKSGLFDEKKNIRESLKEKSEMLIDDSNFNLNKTENHSSDNHVKTEDYRSFFHRENGDFVPEQHLEIPVPDRSINTVLNDTLGSNQNSNICYENAMRDHSTEKIESGRFALDHLDELPTREVAQNHTKPAASFEKVEDAMSFAKANNSQDDSKHLTFKQDKVGDGQDTDPEFTRKTKDNKNILAEDSYLDSIKKQSPPVIDSTKEKHSNMFKDYENDNSGSSPKKLNLKDPGFTQTSPQIVKDRKKPDDHIQKKNYDLIEMVHENDLSEADKTKEKDNHSRDVSFNSTIARDQRQTNNDTLYLSKGSILPRDLQSFNSQVIFVDKHFKPDTTENSKVGIVTPADREVDTPVEFDYSSKPLLEFPKKKNQRFEPPVDGKQKEQKTVHKQPAELQTGGFNYHNHSPSKQTPVVNKEVFIPQDLSTTSLAPTDRAVSNRDIKPRDALDQMVQFFEPKTVSGQNSCLSKTRPNSRQREDQLMMAEEKSSIEDQSINSKRMFGRLGQQSLEPSSHRTVNDPVEKQRTLSEIDEIEPLKQKSNPQNSNHYNERRHQGDNRDQKVISKYDKMMNPDNQVQGSFSKKDYVAQYEPAKNSNGHNSSSSKDRSGSFNKPLSSNGSNRNVKTKAKIELEKRKKLGSHRGISNQSSNKGLYEAEEGSKSELKRSNYANQNTKQYPSPHVPTKDFIAEPFDNNFEESSQKLIKSDHSRSRDPGLPRKEENSYPSSRRRSSPEASKDHLNYPFEGYDRLAYPKTNEISIKPQSVGGNSSVGREKRSELGDTRSNKQETVSDANTMYLNLVLDESVEIEVDIEAVDEESEMSRTLSRLTPPLTDGSHL